MEIRNNNLTIKKNEKINIKTSIRTDKHIITIGNNEDGKLYMQYMEKEFLISDIYEMLKNKKLKKIIKKENDGQKERNNISRIG